MGLHEREIVFVPHPGPQTAFVQCPAFEVVYGGARGGGKTYACLGEWLVHERQFGGYAKGIFLRRTREALKDAIREAKTLFKKIARWKATVHEFHFPSGAVLTFNYLDKDEDAENYQGWQLTRVYIEELTQFPDPAPVLKMMATLRSAKGVPVQFRATCNPGGAGHTWVKTRYVDNGPYNLVKDESTGTYRVFIPAKVTDNPSLLQNDPQYINRLRLSGNEQLVRAWLEGDWSIIEGAFFTEWDPRLHRVPHHEVMAQLNSDARYFMAGDWGSARPFSFGWYVIIPDDMRLSDGRIIPRGAIVRFREYYGMKPGEPNVGLKVPAEFVAQEIRRRSKERHLYRVLDPAGFASDGGPSIAERMARVGVTWRRADNRRIARKGAMGGWDAVRYRLSGQDGVPMFYVTDQNPHFERTVPVLQHDSKNIEDVDTDGEDHVGDEVRYACMSRPWMPRNFKKLKEKNVFTAKAFWKGITYGKRDQGRIRL